MNDWFRFCVHICNHIVEHAIDEIGIWMFAYSLRDKHSIKAIYCRRHIYLACRNGKFANIRQKKFIWLLAMKIPLYFVWNNGIDFPLYELYFFVFRIFTSRPSSFITLRTTFSETFIPIFFSSACILRYPYRALFSRNIRSTSRRICLCISSIARAFI